MNLQQRPPSAAIYEHLTQHPLSAAFPAMSSEDLDALTEDIKIHGQHEPGVLYEDKVLDGWHRYLACEKAGVEFKTYRLNGEDPVAFVISHNLHRRHLTSSQRAMIAADLSKRKQGGMQPTGKFAGCSQAEAAEALKVSERIVRDAKKVAEEAPDLANEVKEGKRTVASALDETKKRKGGKPKKAKKTAPDPEAEKHAPNLADEFERADKQIREQQELIDSLKKDDLAKEVAKWKLKYDQLNGRVQQLVTTTAEAKKTAQYQSDLLAKIRKALKVQKNGEILPALKR